MKCSIDYFESTIRQWTKNLYLLNNDTSSQKAMSGEFENTYYADPTRGLSLAQSASEQGFTVFCWGAVHMPMPQKAMDILFNNSLVNAWRRSVLRNGFQQHYDFFIQCMENTIKKFGVQAVAQQCPIHANAASLLNKIEEMKYKSSLESQNLLKGILQDIAANNGLSPKSPKP